MSEFSSSTRMGVRCAADIIRSSQQGVVLTGAGVSAESGIPTFRGAGGIWEMYDFRKLATPQGFKENPELVWEWYQLRQREMLKALPNPAHHVIAEMERYYPQFSVLTQNIDGMHKRAGSKKVVEKSSFAEPGRFALAELSDFHVR